MATKNSIKFSTILKRSQCLNSITESTKIDSDRLYKNLKQVLEKSKTGKEAGVQHALRSYLESMCDTENVNAGYWQILDLVKEFNKIDSNVSDKIIYEFTTRSLPYMERPVSILECIDNYEVNENQKNTIFEAVSLCTTADRIVKNHNMISKRFNIESFVNKYRTIGLKYFIDSCADMIDTYNTPNYQKMNITLEECTYLLDKNGIKENKADIAKYVVEHFLTMSPIISDRDMENYRRVIAESYVLDESDIFKVKYLFEDSIEATSIESGINKFLINGNKDEESLTAMITNVLNNTSKEDIVYNTDKLISSLWDLAKNKVFESDESIYRCSTMIADYIAEVAKLEGEVLDKNFNKEDVTSIIGSLNGVSIMLKTVGNSNADYSKAADKFIKKALKPCIESLTEVKNLLYNQANIDAINYVNEATDSVPLNEFKLFKFHNLVRAAFNLDKFLKVKEKKFYNKAKFKVNKLARKAKSVLWGESAEVEANIMDYIGEDCKADICIRQYTYNESDLENMIEYMEEVCSEYNDTLLAQDETCRAYFMINPGLAEIRIKESVSVEFEDIDSIYTHLDPAMDLYMEMLIDSDKMVKSIGNIETMSIEDSISNLTNCKEFTLEQFQLALEAMSIIGVDKDIVSVFGDKFNDYHFNYALDNGLINESYISLASQEREVENLVNEFTCLEDVSFEDKLEAFGYLNSLLEYEYPSSADDDDDEDEDDEENEKQSKPEVKKPQVGPKKDDKEESKKSDKKPSEIYKDEIKEIEAMKKEPPKKGAKSGGLNLNNIKLGIMGLKTKYKEMSTKEKELSRNMDNSTRLLVKGMKDALVSDRREAIIKGSIIPSFSRCIKAALGLAVIAHFSLPAAVIAAVGGFALSKKLTMQERTLLLDEIETELEVVDKELAIADSNNEIKKYRTLLQYKKDLQRQYQRIRYNIRVGKDILPGSAAGFQSKEY